MKVIPLLNVDRSCSGCTKCCDGYFKDMIHGYLMDAHQPCHFVTSSGCGIYELRPDSPCKNYKCKWLVDKSLPEWLKPSISNVIVTIRRIGNYKVYELREAGSVLSSTVLSYFVQLYKDKKISALKYQVNGSWLYLAPPEFFEEYKQYKIQKKLALG